MWITYAIYGFYKSICLFISINGSEKKELMLENITKTFNLIFNKESNIKTTGTVKWFNYTMGYCFVVPENGKKDVFIHLSALKAVGLSNIEENQKIEYEVIEEKGRESATNIKLI